MKFLFGFIIGWIIFICILIGLFFYFNIDEYTLTRDNTQEEINKTEKQYNTKKETYNPTLEEQQQNYNDNIKSMTDEEYAEWEKANYPPQKHNVAGTNNYEHAKENGLIEEEK